MTSLFQDTTCSNALVWQNFPVQASVSASSSFSEATNADAAYIDGFGMAWRASGGNTLETEFLQVDFHSVAHVTKLQVRGGMSACAGYVKEFQLLHAMDPRAWEVYSRDGIEPTVRQTLHSRTALHNDVITRV